MNIDSIGVTPNPDDYLPQNQSALDATLLVKFFTKPVQDKKASLQQGRPIFNDTLYIDIRIPGERDSAACRPASPRDLKRFAAHYDAYLKRVGTETINGTPLAEWPQVTRSQVEELAFFNCKTVEQLAGMADSALQKFMGGQALRQKAREWLEANQETERLKQANEQLQAELAKRDERLSALESALAELKAAKPVVAKPRGRPKKVMANASATDSNSE